MAKTLNEPYAHELSPHHGLRAFGFGLICSAIVLSSFGCVRSERDGFAGTSTFHTVPYEMPF